MDVLPRGWDWVEFGRIGKWGSGGTPKSTTLKFYGGTIPWAKSGDLKDGRLTETEQTITEAGLANCPAKILEPGTLLIALYGATIGRVAINEISCATNQAVAYCIPDPEIALSSYLFWFVIASRQSLRELGQGGAQPNISQAILKNFPVPLPPPAEQRRIVARIQALFARTRRARADLERIAPLLGQYKRSLLASTFPEENHESWDSNRHRPFFDILDFKGGTQPPKATFSDTPGSGMVRLLQIRDFASDEKAVYVKDTKNLSKCEADDVLVGRYGASVGKVLRGKAGAYNVALVKMVADWNHIDREYLFNWLQSPAFQNCLLGVSRSAQNGFNKGDLARLTFPLSDLATQKSIASRLVSASNAGKAITRDAKRTLVLLDCLEQKILARAFRGELVPQDPAEPALAPSPASHPSAVSKVRQPAE